MSGNPAAFRDLLANMAHGGKIAMLGIPTAEMPIDWQTVVFNMSEPSRCFFVDGVAVEICQAVNRRLQAIFPGEGVVD
jgi:hypothetical protein